VASISYCSRGTARDARAGGAGLVVFPELGLTGYQFQDLAAEVSMRLDDPRLAGLAAATDDLSAIVSFVEESADHRLFIAAALLEDGRIRHVHRKLFLPTYGLFDERRFFAAGDLLRATPSRVGVGMGIAVCEDFWHLGVPQLLALDAEGKRLFRMRGLYWSIDDMHAVADAIGDLQAIMHGGDMTAFDARLADAEGRARRCTSKGDALRLELAVKRLPRPDKETLLAARRLAAFARGVAAERDAARRQAEGA